MGLGETAQQRVIALALTLTGTLNLTLRTHRMDGENHLPKSSSDLYMYSVSHTCHRIHMRIK